MKTAQSFPEPSIRQALGQSTIENRPFARPLSKKQSQKFGSTTPSKGSFTPRPSRFNPSSRPSTPQGSSSSSLPGGGPQHTSSPVPELDSLNRALTAQAWVAVQIKALARYPKPNPAILLPDSTSAPSSEVLGAWTVWLDGVEAKLERMQVVELPRLVTAAKGPTLEIDTLHVVLSILPLLKTLRNGLAARRDWLELLRLSSEWINIRAAVEDRLKTRPSWTFALSPDLLALASVAHKIRLVIRSAKELRASLSSADQEMLSSRVPSVMDQVWWDLKLGVEGTHGPVVTDVVDAAQENAITCLSCVPRATYSSLIFPSEDPLPVLSPSGTSSSLDILSTSSLHTLSPSNSSTGAVMLASGSSLPNIVGWSGSEEQKRAWFHVSKAASSAAREYPFSYAPEDEDEELAAAADNTDSQ